MEKEGVVNQDQKEGEEEDEEEKRKEFPLLQF